MWFVYALGSAVFAALTSILAKIGIEGVNSTLATAIRTAVVLLMSWGMVFLTGTQTGIADISRRSWLFLVLSGLATGASWLCYYHALQIGAASKVVPIDKLSVVITLALAFVVLYNLSNINITERLRELATIKLLGFYDGEVSAYVYRENIVLTFIGIAVGILMGHYLHTWLVLSTEIDLMMFGRETDPKSYLYAAVLTALFSFLVNLIAHFKMKKIDMVESLKSAE